MTTMWLSKLPKPLEKFCQEKETHPLVMFSRKIMFLNVFYTLFSLFFLDSLIEIGIVPKLVTFLSITTPNPEDTNAMQFEAAWALTNIASGSSMQTRAVVEAGAASHFIKLLSSEVIF